MSAHSGHVFIISAPSGAGKTSLVRALVQDDPRLQRGAPDLGVEISRRGTGLPSGHRMSLNRRLVSEVCARAQN